MRIGLAIIAAVVAIALAEPGMAQAPSLDPRPPIEPAIGARVRVVVPQLGPGWRTGMFNRTRQEPPCYLVLVFDPGPIRRIAVTIPVAAVTRLQVSTRPPGSGSEASDPGAAAFDGEAWTDVALDPVRAAGRPGCSDAITYPRDRR
jgi:hypothetical protein